MVFFLWHFFRLSLGQIFCHFFKTFFSLSMWTIIFFLFLRVLFPLHTCLRHFSADFSMPSCHCPAFSNVWLPSKIREKVIYRSILCLPDLFTCGKRCQTIQNIAVFFHCRYFVYFCLMKSKGIFFVLYHIHIGDHSLTFLCENGLSWWFANRQWMACKTVVKFCHLAQTDH